MFSLILLDRDGVLNVDSAGYIKRPEEWQPLPGAAAALGQLSAAGATLAICTNQSGVARGLYDLATLDRIHEKMRSHLKAAGAELGALYYCPHGPGDGCQCRKPAPGMLLNAMSEFATAPHKTCFVGDSLRDLEAAEAAGCQPVLVRTGNGAASERTLLSTAWRKSAPTNSALRQVPVFDDLAAAVPYLLAPTHRGKQP